MKTLPNDIKSIIESIGKIIPVTKSRLVPFIFKKVTGIVIPIGFLIYINILPIHATYTY